ncbi:MAG: hypothetical protein QM831_38840 [Kofleriaceae bacterium]
MVWSWWKRVAFRFGFALVVLFFYPFPLGYIPKTESIAEWLGKPFEWLVTWFGGSVLGVDVIAQQTGSGDTALGWINMLVLVLLALIVAGIWTAVDRKRVAYPRLADLLWTLLRYALAMTMLVYGFSKCPPAQMPYPDYIMLDRHVGEMSPMGMLWTFMGSSPAYEVFSGLAEITGAVLLLWRRTATLGALILVGVLTNVVLLNFTYDVPVKLYSSQLLLIAIAIAAPQLRRVITVVLGGAAAEVPPRVRASGRWERARLVTKIIVLLGFVPVYYLQIKGQREYELPPSPIDGIYLVESYRGPDPKPWTRVAITARGMSVRHGDESRVRFQFTDVPANGQVAITDDKATALPPTTFTRPDLLRVTLDNKDLHVVLRRMGEPLLTSRGFNWVQELPFNR